MKSDLDILIRRYQVKRSVFDQFCDWYAAKSWWQQTALGLLVVATAAAIGAFFHAIILMTCVAFLITVCIMFILTNHHAIEKERMERLCSDIVKMENDLAVTIDCLSELESGLSNAMDALLEQNRLLTGVNSQLNEQINHLEEQITSFQEIINGLNGVRDRLYTTTQKATDSAESLTSVFDNTAQQIGADADLIHQSTSHLKQTTASLDGNSKALTELYQQLNQQTYELSIHIKGLQNKQDEASLHAPKPETELKGADKAADLLKQQVVESKQRLFVNQQKRQERKASQERPQVSLLSEPKISPEGPTTKPEKSSFDLLKERLVEGNQRLVMSQQRRQDRKEAFKSCSAEVTSEQELPMTFTL